MDRVQPRALDRRPAFGINDFYSNMDYRDLPEPDEPMFAVEHGISADGERAQILVSRYKGSPRRFGLAAWSAHAYYTFHPQTGGQQNRTRGGMMDIFRIPRPVYHWYRSELTAEPMVTIADAWREGVERLRIFSNCDEVELIINGVSLGKRLPDADPDKANLAHPPFTFKVRWEPGEVVARGWTNGEIRATAIARTPATPAGIALAADLEGRRLVADGSDIVLAFARIVDTHGTTVTEYEGKVTFSVDGPAEIVGGPEIGANPMECFEGIAPVLVRAGLQPGQITLRAETDNLPAATVAFESVPFVADEILSAARPIFDLPRVRLDLGGIGQHVQYGWTAWDGQNDSEASLVLSKFGEARIRLRAPEGGQLWWRGEANVPGPLGFVVEDGVCALGELTLAFEGLPAASYRLRTYHFGPASDTDAMDPLQGKIHSADIAELPPAAYLDVIALDEKEPPRTLAAFVPQANGNRVDPAGPTTAEVRFRSDGVKTVRLRIAASNGSGSVWLNGIDLEQRPSEHC